MALAGLTIALAGGRVSAQTLTDGSLLGTVRDTRGLPVNNVVLMLRDRLSGSVRSITVGRSGVFKLSAVVPGEYDLTAEAFGQRPLRVEGIPVRAGVSTHVEAVLTVSADPGTPVEVRRYVGGVSAGTQRFQHSELERFPLAGRELSTTALLSTISNEKFETEGLPGSLSGIQIDGLAVGTPFSIAVKAAAFPLSAFRQAEFQNAHADVEWAGTAAPALAVQSVAAGPRLEVRGFGDWVNGSASNDPLRSPGFKGVQAGALVSGPLVRDTASFVFGMEMWRLETPIALAARADTVAARATGVARDVYDVDLGAYSLDRLAERNAVSGFGRLSWRLDDVHSLHLGGALTALPDTRTAPASLDRIGGRAKLSGHDAYVSATLTSNFSDGLGQEFRLGWDRTLRDYGSALVGGIDEASTSFVQDAFAFGRDPALTGRFATSTFRIRETVHMRGTAHHVKIGATVDVPSNDFTYGASRSNSFWFSSTEDFARSSGYGVVMNGQPAEANFKLPRFGIFLQDEWSLAARVRVLLGARWDMERPPSGDIRENAEWLRLTGLSADSAASRRGRLSPRMELEWRPEARWTLRLSGGIWDAPIDPILFGEALANDGRITVKRGFGTFYDWPQGDGAPGRPSLSLLADGFQGPRSTRGTVQLSHAPAAGVEVVLGGVYRRTTLLPRRTDLNLSNSVVAHDQFGRDLFGVLQKEGSVLAAASGTNRRFSTFDVVSALGVDGWSEYGAVEASLQAQLSRAVNLQARYTYSSTRDNWFMARDGYGLAEPSPFPDLGGSDWTEGRSDFDVPHRLVAGAELAVPALRGVRLAALYRFRSGYPFTPGLPAGVDANGDGSLRNDPAYVDGQSAGLAALASQWPCLQEQAGGFAERNGCRSKSANSLDARVAIGLFGSSGRSAELVVDAFNLLSTGGEEVDRALYLVDAQLPLTTGANGQVAVPLTINPNFGAPLLRASASRTLRVGLRVLY